MWKEDCSYEKEKTEEVQQEDDASHQNKDRIDEFGEKNPFPC